MVDTIGDFLGAAVIDEPKNELVEKKSNDLALQVEEENRKYNEALDFVNDNMRDIITKGMDSLSDVMDTMTDSQEARMYQACAGYIKTLVDANKAYMDINKPITKNSSNAGQKDAPSNVTNIQVNGDNIKLQTPASLLDDD